MAGREPDEAELVAAAVVADHLGGKEEHRDGPGAPDAMHDYDVILPDGSRVALEVTIVADPDAMSFDTVMGDTTWTAAGVRADWNIALPFPEPGRPAIRIKRNTPRLIAALATLEAHGISQLGPGELDPEARFQVSIPSAVLEAIAKLTSIGVTFVGSTSQREGEVARLRFVSPGSVVADPDQLTELVAAAAVDKRRQLAAATDATERHLFIWLFGTYADAEQAFSAHLPPPQPPPIPPGIDVVWLANGSTLLWRLRPPGGWEVVESLVLRERLSSR